MTVNLNGLWHYCTEDNPDFAQPGFVDSDWKTMSIPQNWFLGGLDHHGVVWFRTQFRHLQHEGFTSLHFDGVDYFADVYVNGQHLGNHTGYFEPFAFDVTGTLRSGKNILAVRVESPFETPGLEGWHLRKRLIKGVLNHHDCRPGGGWEPVGQSYNTGGIWNRVHLERHGAITIDRLLLHADMEAHPPVLHAQLNVSNRTQQQRARLEIVCAPENFKGKPQQSMFTLDLPEGESIQKIEMPVVDVRLWQPWDWGFPHLYMGTARLILNKETVSRSSLFGFRTLRVENGFRWFVNGVPYFLRGSNYLPSQWLSETLFPEAARSREHPFGGGAGSVPGINRKEGFYTRDVDLAKQANLNILRVHAHVLPPEFHEACDRAGLLVWQDFALQWGYSDEPEIQAEAEREIQAMVTMLYNHPSIAAWCCHNESPWDAPWMAGQVGGRYDPTHNRDLDARLEAAVRTLDPIRFIHRNSGTGDGHTYPGWYVGHWRDYQDLPAAPFVTEYGAQGLPVRANIQRMLPQFGDDAGFADLLRFKGWLESQKKISAATKYLIKLGTAFWKFTERFHWRHIQEWMKGWGMNVERSIYKTIPPADATPDELQHARQVWETWRFHDFQPAETFDNGISPGVSLDEFIANSQAYQSHLIQYSSECYRRAKTTKVTGLFQFDFTDPWPAVTWSVLDYWRTPKPSFNALRRSMQPVLPSFRLPDIIEAGKVALTSFCVINDLLQAFPGAICEWRLEGGLGDIASATFPVDIPANGISTEVKLTLPSLRKGRYTLSVKLTSGSQQVGENRYDLVIN
jgi:beta-galactosidase/beta-glucuronidase